MLQKFKVGQLVTLIDGFPFENKVFKIVADRETAWKKASPFTFDTVTVDEGKDYIILMQQDNDEFSNERHVNESEIQAFV